MKNNNTQYRLLIPAILFLASTGLASAATDAEPLQLRKIMQSLSADMQILVDATAMEDWPRAEQAAARIADHPTPPMSEKVQILSFMGSKMAGFKAHDDKTHDAASALKQAAHQQDGVRVIEQFAQLQKTCLSCHQNYRASFQQHFYGAAGAAAESQAKMSDR